MSCLRANHFNPYWHLYKTPSPTNERTSCTSTSIVAIYSKRSLHKISQTAPKKIQSNPFHKRTWPCQRAARFFKFQNPQANKLG